MAILIVLGAFLFRLPALPDRPMHTDEAVHAVKLGTLLEHGEYVYDPHEYHGPVIYYLTLPVLWAQDIGTLADVPDETPLRLPIALTGALLAGAVMLAWRDLGFLQALVAALLLATSPAFVFYSRYYIQEVPFVGAMFLAFAAAWKAFRPGSHGGWALAAGVFLGVSMALKETWLVMIGAGVLAAVLLHCRDHGLVRSLQFDTWVSRKRLIRFAVLVVVAFVTGAALLSNFLRHPQAVPDLFRSLASYVLRGVTGDSSTFGAGIHDHPWYYYFELLIWPQVEGPWRWSEGFTLVLGLVGLLSALQKRHLGATPWPFIGVTTILLTIVYCGLPYKTPWNMLPMFLGWTLLAGQGAAVLWAHARHPALRGVVGLTVTAWVGLLAVQSYRANIVRPADARNPYSYSASSTSVLRLAERARQLAAVSPQGNRMLIQIISSANDYWPLPWYLRQFPNIGYYTDTQQLLPGAALVLCADHVTETESTDLGTSVETRLPEHQVEYYGLRPEVILTTMIAPDLWQAFMKTRTEPAP